MTRARAPASSPRSWRSRIGASRLTDLWWALGLSLLAAGHRIAFLGSNADRAWPRCIFYEGDCGTFYQFARAILNGRQHDGGIPFHPPGFAYFLAFIHRLHGAAAGAAVVPHLAIKTTLAGVCSLAIGLLYLLAAPYIGRTAALVAALLLLYHFGHYVISVTPVSEGLYVVLLLASLLLWSRGLEHPLAAPGGGAAGRRRRQPLAGLALGLLLGLMALTRAEAGLTALVLWGTGIGGLIARRARGRALLPWVLLVAGWLLAVAPWTLRNARTLADANRRLGAELAEPLPTFVPITLYGPLNLALANNAGADGSFSAALLNESGRSGELQLTDPEQLRLVLHGQRMAWDYVRAHPGDFAVLVLRKWSIYFEALKLGWTQWDLPGGLAGRRRAADVFAPFAPTALWLLVPGVLAGLALCLARRGPPRRWALVVLLLTAAGLLVTALFYGYVRQGLLLVPLWLSLVSVALVRGGRRLAGRRPARRGRRRQQRGAAATRDAPGDRPSGRLVAVLGAMALLLFLAAARGSTANRAYRVKGRQLPGTQIVNPDMPVEIRPRRR